MNQLRKIVREEEQQIDQLSGELTTNRSELQRLEHDNEALAAIRLDLIKRDQQIADLTRQLDRTG